MIRNSDISYPNPNSNSPSEPELIPVYKSIPCEEPCEYIYWMALGPEDITILAATRFTLFLEGVELSEPISTNNPTVQVNRPRYGDLDTDSAVDFDASAMPSEIIDQIHVRFLTPPGDLVNYPICEGLCECVLLDSSVFEAVGQGEQDIRINVDYDVTIVRGDAPANSDNANIPPHYSEVKDTDGKPVPFDPYTDVLDMYGMGGNWVTWSVIRRYRAHVDIRIKYQATKTTGKCLDPEEVI